MLANMLLANFGHHILQRPNAIQIAHNAVLEAPTAEAAQQALLGYTDVYGTNDNTRSIGRANGIFRGHSRGASGGAGGSRSTAVALSTPGTQENWLSLVDKECTDLTEMVGGHRQARVKRDPRRQNDIVWSLQTDKAETIAKIEKLEVDLVEISAMLRIEHSTKQRYSQQVDRLKVENCQLSKDKSMVSHERDIARQMAELSAGAARAAGESNTQLVLQVASNGYVCNQARTVIQKQDGFHKRTGRSPEEWYQSALDLTQKCQELSSQNEALETRSGELITQLTETTIVLGQANEALKKSETDAWTYTHLNEESGRALEVSQSMHKETIQEAGELQRGLTTAELTLQIERRCAEQLLADSMQANRSKEVRIAYLSSALSAIPEEVACLAKELDGKAVELLQIEQECIHAQRALERKAKLLAREEGKCAALEQLNLTLQNELGGVQFELDVSNDEKDYVHEKVAELEADLIVAMENSRLRQMMSEKNLDELLMEEQSGIREHYLRELRKQLE